MSFIGNLIWVIFGGLISCIMWLISGILACITIIGIPLGLQCFKIAGLVLFPFGKEVEIGRFGAGGLVGNVLWILLLGWELCLMHLTTGLIFCITIIGIPFGMQHFKLAKVSLLPFGARIYSE
ncbi:MAG: YccF domain-containing protein [Clostridiaceae bacterium]|nr:YccF domain-containing protein [Clostridiaceae bacterium]